MPLRRTQTYATLLLATLLLPLSAMPAAAADPAEAKTIGRVVRERADLSKLLLLLDKTELGSRLSEDTGKSFTLFAPTNAAFDKLPDGAVKTLLDPRNDDRLEEVFAYHVLRRSEPAWALQKYSLLRMATGQFLAIDLSRQRVGGARLTGTAVPCSNGVIYLIDTVLTPTTDDLFQTLQKDGRFTIFTRAITASRQGKLFQNMHSLYTVFAPTDDAFAKLGDETLQSLYRPENDDRLQDIIKQHITEGVFAAGKVPGFRSLGVTAVTPKSAFGQQLNFKAAAGNEDGPTIDGAAITQTDVPCANGIVHVIDSVILPAEDSLLDLLRAEEKYTTLVRLLEATGLDLPLASDSDLTLFAPVNSAWEAEPYASLVANPAESRERLYGILARHVISGKQVTQNNVPFKKFRSLHDAPLYVTRDGEDRRVQGTPIVETDAEAFNGLLNSIETVLQDPQELPEGDISAIEAILFIQETLTRGAELYDAAQYEASYRYFERRGYEYLTKYRVVDSGKTADALERAIRDNQTVLRFASEAWQSRNAFRNVLRTLEQREDRVQDQYLMLQQERKQFGR
ncbi:MAG: fasciclin domain-containing protein [Planctomycetota bacterium]